MWPDHARELLCICRENIEDDFRSIKEDLLAASDMKDTEANREVIHKIRIRILWAHAAIVSALEMLMQLLPTLERSQEEMTKHHHAFQSLTEGELSCASLLTTVGKGGPLAETGKSIGRAIQLLGLDVVKPLPTSEDQHFALMAKLLREDVGAVRHQRPTGDVQHNGKVRR